MDAVPLSYAGMNRIRYKGFLCGGTPLFANPGVALRGCLCGVLFSTPPRIPLRALGLAKN